METWITKDGKEIPIKDLKDNHLLNILKFCGKKANEGILIEYSMPAWENNVPDYESEELKGKAALDYLGYYDLLNEAKKRGLKQ